MDPLPGEEVLKESYQRTRAQAVNDLSHALARMSRHADSKRPRACKIKVEDEKVKPASEAAAAYVKQLHAFKAAIKEEKATSRKKLVKFGGSITVFVERERKEPPEDAPILPPGWEEVFYSEEPSKEKPTVLLEKMRQQKTTKYRLRRRLAGLTRTYKRPELARGALAPAGLWLAKDEEEPVENDDVGRDKWQREVEEWQRKHPEQARLEQQAEERKTEKQQ